jgi:hypothetical protein
MNSAQATGLVGAGTSPQPCVVQHGAPGCLRDRAEKYSESTGRRYGADLATLC